MRGVLLSIRGTCDTMENGDNSFTLETHAKVDGKRSSRLLVSFNCIQPAQDRALVIGGATSNEFALFVLDHLERLSGPAILLEGGLHIVMSIDKDGLLVRIMRSGIGAQNDRGEMESLSIHDMSAGIANLVPVTREQG